MGIYSEVRSSPSKNNNSPLLMRLIESTMLGCWERVVTNSHRCFLCYDNAFPPFTWPYKHLLIFLLLLYFMFFFFLKRKLFPLFFFFLSLEKIFFSSSFREIKGGWNFVSYQKVSSPFYIYTNDNIFIKVLSGSNDVHCTRADTY